MDHPVRQVSFGIGDRRFHEGLHVCHIFADDADRSAVRARFIQTGIESGDKALCLCDTDQPEQVVSELIALGLDRELAAARLVAASAAESYCPTGVFSPDALLSQLKGMVEASCAAGFSGLRITGDMAWIHRRGVTLEQVMDYELKVLDYIEGIPCTAVCEYDARRFDGATLLDVLSVHPAVFVHGQLAWNPYYMDRHEFITRFQSRQH